MKFCSQAGWPGKRHFVKAESLKKTRSKPSATVRRMRKVSSLLYLMKNKSGVQKEIRIFSASTLQRKRTFKILIITGLTKVKLSKHEDFSSE